MILRPSAAPRWGRCSGSAALEALYPEDESSPQAREGTAAHFYAMERIGGRVHPIGTLAPNGYPLDQDMLDGGDLMHGAVMDVLKECGPRAKVMIETALVMDRLLGPVQGTPDVVIVCPDKHLIAVIDYKYGHGFVDEYGNLQLIAYFAGVLQGFDLTWDDVKGWDIRLMIVQPRCFVAEQVRTWKFLGWQGREHVQRLAASAAAATLPGAPTLTGDHCKHCLARHACEAAARAGADAAEYAGRSTPLTQSFADAEAELRQLTLAGKRLEARRDALEQVVKDGVQKGANARYFEMKRSPGRIVWNAPAPEIVATADALGVNIRKPDAILTPKQASDAGLDETVIGAYSERRLGEAKLVLANPDAMARRFNP